MEPVPVKQITLSGKKFAIFTLGKQPPYYAFLIKISKEDKNVGILEYAGIYRKMNVELGMGEPVMRDKIDDSEEMPDDLEEIEGSEYDITPPKPISSKAAPKPKPIDEEDTEFAPTKINGVMYMIATNKGDTTATKYVFVWNDPDYHIDRVGAYLGVLENGKIIKKYPAKWLEEFISLEHFKPDPGYEREAAVVAPKAAPPPPPPPVSKMNEKYGSPTDEDLFSFEPFKYTENGKDPEWLKNRRNWVIDSDLNWIGLYHEKGAKSKVFRTPVTTGGGLQYTELMKKTMAEAEEEAKNYKPIPKLVKAKPQRKYTPLSEGFFATEEQEKAAEIEWKTFKQESLKSPSLIALAPKNAQFNLPKDAQIALPDPEDQRRKTNVYFWVGDEPAADDPTMFFKRQYYEKVNGKDTWTMYLMNGKLDVMTLDYNWVGKFQPKLLTIDKTAKKPKYLEDD